MFRNGLIKTILLGFGILLFGASSAYAGFGVSPTNIYNEFLKPGGHFEKTITLSRSDPYEDLDVIIEPSLGEIESWFKYDQGLKFTFPKGETRKSFTVIIDVPEEASYRDFEGVIRVKALGKDGQVKGVSIVKGARLDVNLVTTEDNVTDLKINSLKMLDSVDGEPLKLEIVAENLGNVDVSPDAKITIMDLQMNPLETLEDNDLKSVSANAIETLYAEFSSTVPEGEYFVEAEVLLDGKTLRKERLVFRVEGDRPTEEKTDNEVKTFNFIDFLRTNWIYFGLGGVIALLVFVLLTRVWESERMRPRKNAKWSIFLGAVVLSRIVIAILIALFVSGAFKYVAENYPTEVKEEAKENIVEDKSAVEEDNQESGVDVKGIETVKEKDPEPIIVNLRGEDGKVKYTVYAEPDVRSAAIYYASEDENLEVIEESSNWYRIVLDNGRDGWLEKSNVKSSVVE